MITQAQDLNIQVLFDNWLLVRILTSCHIAVRVHLSDSCIGEYLLRCRLWMGDGGSNDLKPVESMTAALSFTALGPSGLGNLLVPVVVLRSGGISTRRSVAAFAGCCIIYKFFNFSQPSGLDRCYVSPPRPWSIHRVQGLLVAASERHEPCFPWRSM